MKRRLIARIAPALLISALLASAAVPAVAQNAGADAGAGMPGMTAEQMAQQRLSELYANLNITRNEQPAWNQFAGMSMQNASRLDQAFRQRAAAVPKMTAPENLQSFVAIQAQQIQDMQRLSPAFDALYAQLSPQQRQAADQMFRGFAQDAEARHGVPQR
ncbi:MAG: Spy/CpxP family protein refolding chaperone [Pseudomonadota bacterium]|nr:Spy/CpxP family protein refolding chaperone [Pseudomonadota bacterium]